MIGSSNASFIPKRNPNKKERKSTSGQIFIGTFIIRILFFATLIATVGVFFYERNLQSNLDSEIISLDTAINTFNEADLQRVLALELRLNQAKQRLQHGVSIASILNAVDQSTINSNKINKLSLKRVDDSDIEIESEIETGTFDSVLFQRKVLEEGSILAVSEISDVNFQNVPPQTSLFEGLGNTEENSPKVVFKASLIVDNEKFPHKVASFNQLNTQSNPVVESYASSTPNFNNVTDSVRDNQEII